MIPIDKVREIISRHELLEKELASNQVDKKNFAKKSKEYSDLNDILMSAKQYLSFNKSVQDLEKILNDGNTELEMRDLAKIELDELFKNKKINEKKLKIFLLPKDDADKKNAIIEIRAGTGGLEASLFAADLFKMYEKVSNKKKWLLELISISKSDAGGLKKLLQVLKEIIFIRHLSLKVEYIEFKEFQKQKLKEEFILAATVAVLPEAEEVDVKIDEKDLRIDVFRSRSWRSER